LVTKYPKILTDAKEKRKDRILTGLCPLPPPFRAGSFTYGLGMLNFELNLKPKLGKKDTKRGRLEL